MLHPLAVRTVHEYTRMVGPCLGCAVDDRKDLPAFNNLFVETAGIESLGCLEWGTGDEDLHGFCGFNGLIGTIVGIVIIGWWVVRRVVKSQTRWFPMTEQRMSRMVSLVKQDSR